MDAEQRNAKLPRGCGIFALVGLVAGIALCGWGYIALAHPVLIQGVATRQINQSVCGTWQTVSGSMLGPSVPGLYDLDGSSDTDIWGIRSGPQVVHWDGSSWRESDLSKPDDATTISLSDIDVVASNDVWIVGEYEIASDDKRTVTYHWDGSQWAIVPSPSVKDAENSLYAVSGSASDDVWAVGSYRYSANYRDYSLVLHWDGESWSRSTPVDNCAGDQLLFGTYYSLSDNDAWAVGSCGDGTLGAMTDTVKMLIQHWDGKDWSVIPGPNHGSQYNFVNNRLSELHGTGPNDLWATGSFGITDGKGSFMAQPLLAHWDGKDWSEVELTHSSLRSMSSLDDLIAVAPDDVWITGYGTNANLFPLVMHWDGTDWSQIDVPNPLAEGYFTSLFVSNSKLTAGGFGFDDEDGASYGIIGQFDYKACTNSKPK